MTVNLAAVMASMQNVKTSPYILPGGDNKKTESIPMDPLYYGTFEDPDLEKQCQELTKNMENRISRSSENNPSFKLLIPHNLIPRIARDICRMSLCEPCALRGCVLFTEVRRKDGSTHSLGRIVCDAGTPATFELYLTLIEDGKKWTTVKSLVKPIVFKCFKQSWVDDIHISPGFQLVKKKLYRPN